MNNLYLTPASISYLSQFILSLLMTAVLADSLFNRKHFKTQGWYHFGFLCCITIFSALLFFETTLLPGHYLIPVYLENPVLAIGLVFLYLFIYRFPKIFSQHRFEAGLAVILSLAYAGFEIIIAIHRFNLLLMGTVEYRFDKADTYLAIVVFWIPIAFLRQSILADERPISWYRKIWNPEGVGARSSRAFAAVFIIPILLAITEILRSNIYLSTLILNISISIGILTALWLLGLVYLKSQPVSTSFQIKLTGTTLTLVLVIFGTSSRVITPSFIDAFQPALTVHESLRFTPDSSAGYSISKIPFQYETDLGQRLDIIAVGDNRSQRVDFTFPFFGKTYTQVYPTSVGLVKMGDELYHPNLQYHYGQMPAIFPLQINLDPSVSGGVFVRKTTNQLVVTWKDIPSLQQHNDIYNFQVVMYSDGHFEFNYKNIPADLNVLPDSAPYENIWLRGVTPGISTPVQLTTNLSVATHVGPEGLLQDFNLSMRAFLHKFMLPWLWLLIIGTVFLFLVIPALLYEDIIKPLNVLLASMHQVDAGNLDVSIPIQNLDEIGLLTQSYNNMVSWLKTLVSGLEERVSERTIQLQLSNQQLEREISERMASQEKLIEQQRSLAIFDERERVSRDLHDGFAQVISSIRMHTITAQNNLLRGDDDAANANLKKVLKLAADVNVEIRNVIMGLRLQNQSETDIFGTLEEYLKAFSAQTQIHTSLSIPGEQLIPLLTPTAEDQLLRIIQESLTNIRKHAQATNVEITFHADERSVHITISDDGNGFDPLIVNAPGSFHFGLNMMRERVTVLGGRMEIRSAPKNGTKILIFVPRSIGNVAVTETNELSKLRVLLVDDSPIFLDGMQTLLVENGLLVVGLAHNGLDAQEKTRQLHPDMVVMDVIMPKCNGVDAALAIKTEFPLVKIVMLSSSEKPEHLFAAIKNGASGFILKDADPAELLATLEKVARGEMILSPELAMSFVKEFSHNNPGGDDIQLLKNEKLSDTQEKIIELVANGMTYQEVSMEMYMTERAVKYQMKQIFEILHLKKRTELVKYRLSHKKG